jgi:uncharacterized GH25 family protein
MTKLVLISSLFLFTVAGVFAAAQSAGTLKGKIENDKGKPVADAEVRAMSTRDRSVKETRTDSAGNYSFELAPDDYVVSFDAEGFQGGTLREMQQVEAGKETRIKTLKLQRAKRSSLIRGTVFDTSGLSLAGARVKLERVPSDETGKDKKNTDSLTRNYTTNSRGEFAFRLPATRARYQLTAILSGYKPETKTVDVNPDEAVPLAFNLEPLKK